MNGDLSAFHLGQALDFNTYSFFEYEHALSDAEAFGFRDEAFDGFVVRFISKRECAVVHGDEDTGFHLDERSNSLLGIHVDISAAWGVVGTDRHESNIGRVVFADFLKTIEISAVAAVENFAHAGGNHVAAVVAVSIVQVSCAPMVARGVGDTEIIKAESVPARHFMHGVKA